MPARTLPIAILIFCSICQAQDVVPKPAADAPAAGQATAPATNPAHIRLQISAASPAVRARIFKDYPRMDPAAVFPLKELTTAEVWEQLHVQVFVVTHGVLMYQGYLIDGDR
ncbi:MAG: hypothetical protein ACHRHE_25125, partial [Tepidisphaerales bacterium]